MERRLTERLPARLLADPWTAGISEAMAAVGEALFEAACGLVLEFSAATATETGIAEWERLTGLTPARGATLEQRRSAVIAQLCAGGTTNAALVESMARAITGYDAKVTENFADYTFSLRFYGQTAGFIAVDDAALAAAVELVKPAHLRFVIQPVTWEDIEDAALTWAQLEETFDSWAELETSHFRRALG